MLIFSVYSLQLQNSFTQPDSHSLILIILVLIEMASRKHEKAGIVCPAYSGKNTVVDGSCSAIVLSHSMRKKLYAAGFGVKAKER